MNGGMFRRVMVASLLGLAVFVVLAVLPGTGITSADDPAQHPIPPENRQPLQTFVLNQYQGGAIDFADYRGRVVLVNFWATWCAPCIAEFPSLLALKDHFADQPFEILAINMGEPKDSIADFLDSLDRAINFPVLMDRPVITVAKHWPVRALPTTIIVDKTGKRAFQAHGERPWNTPKSHAILHPLLHE